MTPTKDAATLIDHSPSAATVAMPWLARLCGALWLCLVGACDNAGQAQPYLILAPPGNGPFPAVLLASGCSGFNNYGNNNVYEEKAEALRQAGYYVIYVDYLKKRGLKNCSGTLTPEHAAQDLIDAADWARKQPRLDPQRISAIGWSFGGGVVLAALAQMPRTHPSFFKAVALYPPCPPRYTRSVIGCSRGGASSRCAADRPPTPCAA